MKKRENRRWKEEEIQFLHDNLDANYEDIAKKLDRSPASVKEYARYKFKRNMKKTKKEYARKTWSEDDLEFLKENYYLKNSFLCEKLGRKTGAIKNMKRKLGLQRKQDWNQDQIDFLKGNYYSMTLSEISSIVKKQESTIEYMASALGISEKRLDCQANVDWRNLVFSRDSYKCRICGSKKDKNVHHLDGWNWCIERRFDVDNGITLCGLCHDDFHTIYGRGNNTVEQFNEYITKCLFLPFSILRIIK